MRLVWAAAAAVLAMALVALPGALADEMWLCPLCQNDVTGSPPPDRCTICLLPFVTSPRAISTTADSRTAYDWYRRGIIYEEAGCAVSATAAFTEAIQLDRQSDVAFIARATVFAVGGDPKRALADLDRAIAITSGQSGPNPWHLLLRGSIRTESGDRDGGRRDLASADAVMAKRSARGFRVVEAPAWSRLLERRAAAERAIEPAPAPR